MTNMDIGFIQVDMACYAVGKNPQSLIARGIGSCVAVSFYDSLKKIGALCHIMLPEIREIPTGGNPLRFADHMIDTVLKDLTKENVLTCNLEAKIAGGANMFPFLMKHTNWGPSMGERNVEKVREILRDRGIMVAGEDVGGNYGRSVHFHLDTGIMTVEKKI